MLSDLKVVLKSFLEVLCLLIQPNLVHNMQLAPVFYLSTPQSPFTLYLNFKTKLQILSSVWYLMTLHIHVGLAENENNMQPERNWGCCNHSMSCIQWKYTWNDYLISTFVMNFPLDKYKISFRLTMVYKNKQQYVYSTWGKTYFLWCNCLFKYKISRVKTRGLSRGNSPHESILY